MTARVSWGNPIIVGNAARRGGNAQRVELAGLGHRGEKILIVGTGGNGERAAELGARLVRAAAGEGLESDAAAGAVGLVVAP